MNVEMLLSIVFVGLVLFQIRKRHEGESANLLELAVIATIPIAVLSCAMIEYELALSAAMRTELLFKIVLWGVAMLVGLAVIVSSVVSAIRTRKD